MPATDLSAELKTWLDESAVMPESFTIQKPSKQPATFVIMDRDGNGRVRGIPRGKKGFVLKVRDPDTDAVYAAKFCIAADYDGARSERDEAVLAAKLRDARDLFAPPLYIGRVRTFEGMPGPEEGFVCFISDWIDGQTIESISSYPPHTDSRDGLRGRHQSAPGAEFPAEAGAKARRPPLGKRHGPANVPGHGSQ